MNSPGAKTTEPVRDEKLPRISPILCQVHPRICHHLKSIVESYMQRHTVEMDRKGRNGISRSQNQADPSTRDGLLHSKAPTPGSRRWTLQSNLLCQSQAQQYREEIIPIWKGSLGGQVGVPKVLPVCQWDTLRSLHRPQVSDHRIGSKVETTLRQNKEVVAIPAAVQIQDNTYTWTKQRCRCPEPASSWSSTGRQCQTDGRIRL